MSERVLFRLTADYPADFVGSLDVRPVPALGGPLRNREVSPCAAPHPRCGAAERAIAG